MLTALSAKATTALAMFLINTQGIQDWVKTNVIPLIGLVIGGGICFAARKRDISGSITQIIIFVLGLSVMVGTAVYMSAGGDFAKLIGG